MTTAARRARKKANRKAKLERLAELLEGIDALGDADDEEIATAAVVRPESEKAAAVSALSATEKLLKRVRKNG